MQGAREVLKDLELVLDYDTGEQAERAGMVFSKKWVDAVKPNLVRSRLKKRVLLVEDDVSTIEVVEMELKHLGYEVSIAISGLEAVEMAFANPPDLIIMDMRLPKMDGFAATGSI